MSWDSDFLELMPHTVVISTRSGHSAYGTATYSTAGSTYRARVVDKPGFLRTSQGEVVETRTVAWVASTGTITVADRVTLPDGTSPPVALVERYADENGTYFHKLTFRWTGSLS